MTAKAVSDLTPGPTTLSPPRKRGSSAGRGRGGGRTGSPACAGMTAEVVPNAVQTPRPSLLPRRFRQFLRRGAGLEGEGRIADAPHGAAVAFAVGVGHTVVDRQIAGGERPCAFDFDRLARVGADAAVVAGDEQRRAGFERDKPALAEGVEVERRARITLE